MATSVHEAHHHLVPVKTYVKTILTLLVLMVTTVYVGEYAPKIPDIGPISGTVLNQFVALLIAVVKAYLVVTIFMGVKWGTTLTKFWAMIGFSWLGFFSIMWGDYGTRKYEPVQGWDAQGEFALPRNIQETDARQPAPQEYNVRPRQ